jgi:TolB protein
MNINGSEFSLLGTLPSYLGIPRFSPDGTQIAVSSNQLEIWSSSIILTNLQGEYKEYPFFHTPFYDPVENYIYVGSYGGGIYKMDLFSEEFTKLTEHENDFVSSISSEGIDIAFISKRDGNYEIYYMNSDGSNQTNLTQNAARDWGSQIQPQPEGL